MLRRLNLKPAWCLLSCGGRGGMLRSRGVLEGAGTEGKFHDHQAGEIYVHVVEMVTEKSM